MTLTDWNEVAGGLAEHVRSAATAMHRGALIMGCPEEDSWVAVIFGNDDYRCREGSRRGVGVLRRRLADDRVEELGFGLSHDGFSWALLIRKHQQGCATVVGRSFQLEMWKIALEETVRKAWRSVGESANAGDMEC